MDGHLVSIPAKRSRRHVVLEYIVARFEPGVRYPSGRSTHPAAWHPDHASLRRHLVDEDLLARDSDGTSYWRIGGPVN